MQLSEEALSHPSIPVQRLATGMIKITHQMYFQTPEKSQEREIVDTILKKASGQATERPYNRAQAARVLEVLQNAKDPLSQLKISTLSLCLASEFKNEVQGARVLIEAYFRANPEKGATAMNTAHGFIKSQDSNIRLAGLTLVQILYDTVPVIRENLGKLTMVPVGKALLDVNETVQRRAFSFVQHVMQHDGEDEAPKRYAFPFVNAALQLRRQSLKIQRQGSNSPAAHYGHRFNEAYLRSLRLLGFLLVCDDRDYKTKSMIDPVLKITGEKGSINCFDLDELLRGMERRQQGRAQSQVAILRDVLLPPDQRKRMQQQFLNNNTEENGESADESPVPAT